MPARMAFLMPSAAWAWAITHMPAAAASDTSTSSSSIRKCLLHPQVRPTGVPDSGDADVEGRPEVLLRLVEAVGERLLHQLPQVDVAEHHVRVAVEEAWKKGAPGDVDGIIAIQAWADVHDPVALDHQVGRRAGCRPRVEHLPTCEHSPC